MRQSPPAAAPPRAKSPAAGPWSAECSLSHAFTEHGADCLPDNHHVEPPGAILDIFDVVFDPFLEVGARAAGAADLPEPGHTRTHAQSRLAPWRAELVL